MVLSHTKKIAIREAVEKVLWTAEITFLFTLDNTVFGKKKKKVRNEQMINSAAG